MNNSPEKQLALRYAQIADDRKFAEMRNIISGDFTQQGPTWQCEGADAFIEQLQVLETNFSATLHMVGNQMGQWDGECYEGETYSICLLYTSPSPRD